MVKNKVLDIENADGEVYRVLATPGEVVYKNVEHFQSAENVGDGFLFYHFYILAIDVKENCLPNEANPREPSRGNARDSVIDKMHHTLQQEPERFHHFNNGMTLVADNVIYNKQLKQLTIKFATGDGICNGGHTYFAISTFEGFLPDKCYVHLEVIQTPPNMEEERRRVAVKDIATCRNSNRQLAPATQADYLNLYDSFKSVLGDNSKFVRWHEGDSEAHEDSIDSVHFIRLLASLDPYWFSHPVFSEDGDSSNVEANHGSAVRGKSAAHKRWFSAKEDEAKKDDYHYNLDHMAFLANELLRLRDMLSFSIKNDTFQSTGWRFRGSLFSEWLCRADRSLYHGDFSENVGVNLPDTFEVMIIGAFRHNIWLANSAEQDEDIRFIGYYDDPKQLWDEAKSEYLKELQQIFNSLDNNKNRFCKADNALNIQLTRIVHGLRYTPTKPLCFCDIATNCWYVLSNSKTPNYILIIDPEEKEAELINYTKGAILDEFNIGYDLIK